MGRPLKEARLSPEQQKLISAVRSRRSDPIPHSAVVLRRAIECIITNIEARNLHEGRVLKACLQYLAGLEALKPKSMNHRVFPVEEKWLKELGRHFAKQGGLHTRRTIALQRQHIIDY